MIVQLASSGELGGAERIVLDILTETRHLRPEWLLHLIVPQDGGLAARARDLGVSVTVVPWSPAVARLGDAMAAGSGLAALLMRLLRAVPQILSDAARVGRAIRTLRPSLVHAHGFKMQVLALWARPWRTPLVLHLHDYVGSRRVMSRALRIAPPGRVAAVAISHDVAADARRALGPRLRLVVIHNGIDLGEWGPVGPTADLDAMAGLPPAAPHTVRVGLVATMARWKGHETFLRALALLPRGAAIRGYVIGGSIYQTDASQYTVAELRRLAATLGIQDRVGFTGFVDDPASAIRALDIVVHASVRPEPFGRVIIEGMAAQRAVIARASGGASELFVDGVEGVASHTDQPRELAGILERLAGDRALRLDLGARGRARVDRDFSRRRMTSQLVQVYSDLLAGS